MTANDETSATVLHNWAICLLYLGRTEESQRILARLNQLNPQRAKFIEHFWDRRETLEATDVPIEFEFNDVDPPGEPEPLHRSIQPIKTT